MLPLNFLGLGNGLTKGFIAVLLVLIALIIVPNLGQIYAKLGFETVSTMKGKVDQANADKNTAIGAAETNNATVITLGKVDKAKDEVVVEVLEKGKTVDKGTTIRIANRDRKIDDIKKKPNLSEKEITPELKLAVELSGESLEKVRMSQVNIATIWDSYCSTSDQCKGTT